MPIDPRLTSSPGNFPGVAGKLSDLHRRSKIVSVAYTSKAGVTRSVGGYVPTLQIISGVAFSVAASNIQTISFVFTGTALAACANWCFAFQPIQGSFCDWHSWAISGVSGTTVSVILRNLNTGNTMSGTANGFLYREA